MSIQPTDRDLQRSVIYIPGHAVGDRNHKDCEKGRLDNFNDDCDTAFVKFPNFSTPTPVSYNSLVWADRMPTPGIPYEAKTVNVDGVEWEYQPDQACWTNDSGEVHIGMPVSKTKATTALAFKTYDEIRQRIELAFSEDDPTNYENVKDGGLSERDIKHIAALAASVIFVDEYEREKE